MKRRCCICHKMTEKWQRINGGPWHCYDRCKSATGADARKKASRKLGAMLAAQRNTEPIPEASRSKPPGICSQ